MGSVSHCSPSGLCIQEYLLVNNIYSITDLWYLIAFRVHNVSFRLYRLGNTIFPSWNYRRKISYARPGLCRILQKGKIPLHTRYLLISYFRPFRLFGYLRFSFDLFLVFFSLARGSTGTRFNCLAGIFTDVIFASMDCPMRMQLPEFFPEID